MDSRYYDFQWQQTGGQQHPYIAEKIKLIMSLIPPDVKVIADIGCGDGTIANALADKYDVIGADISEEGLRKLSPKVKQILSSATDLPVESKSIDLVLTSELLEHLPDGAFETTVSEISRISRKYILVTVPNNEKLRQRFTRCLNCGNEFHIYCHLRSFTLEKLASYFPGYIPRYNGLCGALDGPSFDTISYLKNKLAKEYFFVDTVKILCPRCGKVTEPFWPNMGYRAIGFGLYLLQNSLNFVLNRKPEPDWLVVLFEKEII